MLRTALRPAALAASVLLAAAGQAAGQWTVINLHPTGAASSEARAISGAQQVGVADVVTRAMIWNGAALSARQLSPAGAVGTADSVAGSVQAGSVVVGTGLDARTHAVIWTGTADSMVDLHPGAEVAVHSNILATDGTIQGGTFLPPGDDGMFGTGRPCLWMGTAGSFVDLTPAGIFTGAVLGVAGNQQVGAHYDNFLGTACMWEGSAESFIILQPPEGLFSTATCTDGVHQYGVLGVLEPVPGLFPARWSGTAESWVLLDIPADRWGEVHATHGGYQVGYITDTDGISNARACIWTGEPDTYLDLHQFLPANFVESNALGIWRHTASGTSYVVGWAVNNATSQREAVMWVNGPDVNLITSAAAPPDDSASVGQPMVFTIRVLNAGPASAAGATLVVDLPPAAVATFASAAPAPTSVTATQATFDLGALAASGGFTDVTLTLTAAGPGVATITATSSAALEADPTNNAATVSSRIPGVACPADFNGVGGVTVQDIFDFLAAYFSNDPSADFNGVGGVTVQDIFDFLAAYFSGC